jgi:hypothetical protein
MKLLTAGCAFLLSSMPVAAAQAQTAVSVDARLGDFHVAVANYYNVPQREVIAVRDRYISDEDLPVVFFIAREARVPAARVIALRDRGRSWWDISVAFRLRPEAYYVPLPVDPGPPYGHAYGHFKKPRRKWHTIVLSDAEVVNLVHLRFLSEHYRVPPERVVEARGRHRNVVALYTDLGHRHGKSRPHEQASTGRGNGNGRGR